MLEVLAMVESPTLDKVCNREHESAIMTESLGCKSNSPSRGFDRYTREQDGIDVLLLTLDAETFLERSLISLYAEVPVARLIVCDGGSTDRTATILRGFPRVELHVCPDIRTTGKGMEFLLSKVKTEWVMLTDSDLTFPEGWYDEMCKYRKELDAFDSRRIHAYEFYEKTPPQQTSTSVPAYHLPRCSNERFWRNSRLMTTICGESLT